MWPCRNRSRPRSSSRSAASSSAPSPRCSGSAKGDEDAPYQLDKNNLTTAFFNCGKAVVEIDHDPDQATIVCVPLAIRTTLEGDAMFAWYGQWRGDGGTATYLVHCFIHELERRLADNLADNFARNWCCRPWFKLWADLLPPALMDVDDEESRRFQRSMRDEAQFLRRVPFQEAMRNDAQFQRFQQIFRLR